MLASSSIAPQMTTWAQETIQEEAGFTYDFTYVWNEETGEYEQGDTLEITGYTGNDTEIVIPSQIDGKLVTALGQYVFYDQKNLTSVIIPEGVTEIKSNAFSGCSNLVNITIPEGVVSIDSAFSGCSKLKEIALPESLEYIGESTFRACTNLTEITIPENVTEIGGHAFSNCSSLTSVTIPEGVTDIKESLFRFCDNLTEVIIPKSITNIGDEAFLDCAKLNGITIPAGVTSIGEGVFGGCSSLTEFQMDEGCTACIFQDGVLYSKDMKTLLCCVVESSEVMVPEGVVKIGSNAFRNRSGLAEITLPEGIESIGEDAFYYCKSLSGITLPQSVTSVGSYSFSGCTSLQEINMDNKTDQMGYMSYDGALYNKHIVSYLDNDKEMLEVELVCCPEGKKTLRYPEEMTYLYNFGGQSSATYPNLTRIEIPANLTRIGMERDLDMVGYSNVFDECFALEEIVVDPNNKSYMSQDGILYNKDMTELVCCPRARTEITIPQGVTFLRKDAFQCCDNLTKVAIPESVEEIEYYDPLSGDDFFDYANVFKDCSNLLEITVDDRNNHYTSKDGVLYTKDMKTLICCPATKSELEIPESITKIDYYALNGCEDLTLLVYPGSYAETYAKNAGLKYSYAGECPHKYESRITKQATCIAAGEKTFTCKECGDVYTETIPIIKHQIVEDAAVEATCVLEGKTEGSHCVVCGTVIKQQQTIPAIGHSYRVKIKKATTEKNGSIIEKCNVCGDEKKQTKIYAVKTVKLSKTSCNYNKKVQKPSVIVKDKKGISLTEGMDYTVSYSKGMKNVGNYIVTIKFKGNYSGTIKKNFSIIPKTTSIVKVTSKKKGFVLKWKKQADQTTGYEIAYSTNKRFTEQTTRTQTINKSETTIKSITKLAARKKYFVKIRTYKTIKSGGKSEKIYSEWSKVKTVTTKK